MRRHIARHARVRIYQPSAANIPIRLIHNMLHHPTLFPFLVPIITIRELVHVLQLIGKPQARHRRANRHNAKPAHRRAHRLLVQRHPTRRERPAVSLFGIRSGAVGVGGVCGEVVGWVCDGV